MMRGIMRGLPWGTLAAATAAGAAFLAVGWRPARDVRRRGCRVRHRVWLRMHRATPGEIAATIVSVGLLVLAFANPMRRWVTVFAVAPDDRWARTTALRLVLLLVAAIIVLRATRDPRER